MYVENLIEDGLRTPPSTLTYHVSRHLASLYPERTVFGTADTRFDLLRYAAAEQCLATPKPSIYHQASAYWQGVGQGLWYTSENGWFEVSWQGQRLDVLLMSWPEGHCRSQYYWILADTREMAERFFLSVCEWGAEVRREILVFQGGDWERSEELYQAIKGSTFENLVLPEALKTEVQEDFHQFFQARATYEKYRIPWKRGLLFVGPPGNGKTHAIKALLNSVEYPCLYVKSLKTPWGTDHDTIRSVFECARQTTPCILVLEDLDAVIHSKNRSYFLNELDGFAANWGILTLATTNHPERLDPAIVERPSRFDRKYHFELPAPAERRAYIALWNAELEPEMRLSETMTGSLVELTDGFSFAYMKELFLSSMVRWIGAPTPGGMDTVISAQAAILREQMSSMVEMAESDEDDAGEDED